MQRELSGAGDAPVVWTHRTVLLTEFSSTWCALRETYIVDALDIKQTVARRLSFLPPSEFEELLHSVFKEDELTLIALGAFLGGLVGLLQAFLVFFS